MASAVESLTVEQIEIYNKITKDNVEDLKTLLATTKTKLDFVDENGMSLLQHACYKGNTEIVQMLLDHGVDVNQCQHQHGYTALHFAALSGNADLCYLLMSHGARISARNSVNRTAAQMAAFVGNHQCVVKINNFVPRENIDYYITPQGLQKEPLLPPHLADSFHKFIMQVNVHPVRVAMNLQRFHGLLENLAKVQKVLETMSQKMIRLPVADTNEVMAFKYHYLSFVVAEVIKIQNRQKAMKGQTEKEESQEAAEEKKSDPVEALVRKFLKCSKADGIPEYQEAFLREAIREFPFRDCTIFHQMVAILSSSDPSSAASVIAAAINGQRGFLDQTLICVTCSEEKVTKKCSKCKAVQYCDRECQRLHWFIHKKACTRLCDPSTNSGAKLTHENTEKIANTISSTLKHLTVN